MYRSCDVALITPLRDGMNRVAKEFVASRIDQTGASLEAKEYSLAWHYRRADPEQGSVRAKELMDDLGDYTRNIDAHVLEGSKVIEVRNAGVTKGAGALEWLSTITHEFVLAFRDDWTDEDMFRALPAEA